MKEKLLNQVENTGERCFRRFVVSGEEQLSNEVENIVASGEIARFEQFFLLQQYFQKSSAAEASESICMWERINE